MFVANLLKIHDSNKGQKRGFLGIFSSGKGNSQSRKNDKIVIKKNLIHVISEKGYVVEEVDVNTMERIMLNDPYNIGFGNIPSHYRDLGGKNAKNMLILEREGNTQKFEFAIESTHDMCELRKQILFWKSQGHLVQDKNLNIDIG